MWCGPHPGGSVHIGAHGDASVFKQTHRERDQPLCGRVGGVTAVPCSQGGELQGGVVVGGDWGGGGDREERKLISDIKSHLLTVWFGD